MVDIVISYVNFNNKIWQDTFNKYYHGETDIKRFERLDILKYVLNSIKKYALFDINNIYIVVSHKSEIPVEIQILDKVHIIEHIDIIPIEYLPTFNSSTIDLFLYRIPNLSEKFIYFNDDVLLINPLIEEDFYTEDNIPKLFTAPWYKSKNQFSNFDIMIKNIEHLIWNNSNNITNDNYILYSDHGPIPMLKSVWKELFDMYGNIIYDSITQFRDPKNICAMIFIYYIIKIHGTNKPKITNKYILVNEYNTISELIQTLTNSNNIGYICLNVTEDSHINDFGILKKQIYDCLTHYYGI